MTILTRDDVYNKMVTDERPRCPHCDQEMVIWECPPINFSDGLGWGSPYLYVCFNDDCPLYLNGWQSIMKNYAGVGSYRCICDPMSMKMECMPVFSRDGGRGYIIDEQIKAEEEARKAAEEKGLKELDVHCRQNDAASVLKVVLSDKAPRAVRLKAAEIIGEIGGIEVVEPIRNCAFDNDALEAKIADSIEKIHRRNYTKECPFCAEIIKARAVVCKHCGKDLP